MSQPKSHSKTEESRAWDPVLLFLRANAATTMGHAPAKGHQRVFSFSGSRVRSHTFFDSAIFLVPIGLQVITSWASATNFEITGSMLLLPHIWVSAMILPYDDSYHHDTFWSDSQQQWQSHHLSFVSCFFSWNISKCFHRVSYLISRTTMGGKVKYDHFQFILRRLKPRKVRCTTWDHPENKELDWDVNKGLFTMRPIFYPLL